MVAADHHPGNLEKDAVWLLSIYHRQDRTEILSSDGICSPDDITKMSHGVSCVVALTKRRSSFVDGKSTRIRVYYYEVRYNSKILIERLSVRVRVRVRVPKAEVLRAFRVVSPPELITKSQQHCLHRCAFHKSGGEQNDIRRDLVSPGPRRLEQNATRCFDVLVLVLWLRVLGVASMAVQSHS